jgi:hypothetical protein
LAQVNEYIDHLYENAGFLPWQPSTWPAVPALIDDDFISAFAEIPKQNIVVEINNVISDATIVNGDLQRRGHVVAIAMFSAVSTLSTYAYRGTDAQKYVRYVQTFFPGAYRPYADELYGLFRTSTVHNWNLFEVGMYPGHEPIDTQNGVLCFGLLNFNDALSVSIEAYLGALRTDPDLQLMCRKTYSRLRGPAQAL